MNKRLWPYSKVKFLCTGIFLFAASLHAQLPETDIFLFEIKRTNVGIILHKGSNITNRKGYDNQPCFSPDTKKLLFTSDLGKGQTDIYAYTISSKKTTALTSTVESEYSPQYAPDGKMINAVVVEQDSTQVIYKYNAKGECEGRLADTDSVGYFAWLNKDSLLYYKLTAPHSLRVLDLKSGKDNWLYNEPTRSFKATKGKWEFFVVTKGKDNNFVWLYNTRLKKASEYAKTKPENEDFNWDKVLGLIKSEGSKLMRYNDDIKTWVELCDLSAFGISKITRFTISQNGRFLALVSNK